MTPGPRGGTSVLESNRRSPDPANRGRGPCRPSVLQSQCREFREGDRGPGPCGRGPSEAGTLLLTAGPWLSEVGLGPLPVTVTSPSETRLECVSSKGAGVLDELHHHPQTPPDPTPLCRCLGPPEGELTRGPCNAEGGRVWALTRRVAIDPHPAVDGPGAEGHPAQSAEDVTVPLSLQRQPCALRTHRGHV